MIKRQVRLIFEAILITAILTFPTIGRAGKSIPELAETIRKEIKGLNAFNRATEIAELTPANKDEVFILLELIQKTENPVREKLINSLAHIKDPQLARLFIKELASPCHIIKAISAGICGKFKFIEAEKDIIKIVKQSPPIEGFPDDDQERALVTAVLALGELQQDSSLDLLISLIGKLKGYEIKAIRKFGIKPLPTLLNKLNEPDLSSNANMAITQIIMATEDKAATPILEKEVAKKESKARSYAITLLLKMDQEKYLPEFTSIWKKDPDPVLETRLLYFINSWRLGDSRHLPFLIGVLKNSSSPTSRQLAVTSLSRIKDKKAITALKEATKDEDKNVRLYATQALEMMDKN